MNDPIALTIPNEMQHEAALLFYHTYGIALAEWSRLENSLHLWFARATRMPDKLSRAIFFSAKSFSSRAELLEAAIGATIVFSEDEMKLIKAIIRKSRKYSEFRNLITHSEPRLHINAFDNGNNEKIVSNLEFKMIDGKDDIEGNQKKIEIHELQIAAKNFRELRRLSMETHPSLNSKESHAQLLERVLRLPNQANSTDIPNQPKQKSQSEQPERVNKKAHRAQQKSEREAQKE